MTQLLALLAEPTLPKLAPSDSFWLPVDASVTTRNIDWVWDFLVWISVLTALAIFVAMFHFVTKYKAKSRAANEHAEKSAEHNTALEITWSVLPLFVVIALFVWGFKGFVDLRTPPKDSMELHANAQKWKWTFDYQCARGGLTDDTLHVPVDRPVRMLISSVDVLHALYIPSFRTKMDAVPGRYTDMWFQATKPGDYPIFCAEYCGTSHSDMLSHVVVHPPGEYETWLKGACEKADSLVGPERGKKLYSQQGCETCHTIDGTPKIGPSWKGLFGKSESITGGPTVKVDENYLRESMMDPTAKVVQGFAPSMPTYKGKLSDKDIDGLIEYIKTLK
ncbi:MAG TPA: cytochrome c oxidase subunit II [Polyangiaceae bacterium]|nr:cytochrome c oxidase subunit II [Polyangiaceae bacterium]